MMEDALWREATGPAPAEIDVQTRFGVTRAYRWAGDGTPIVFLHGGGMTSVSWAPYAQALSSREVYAVDIMGDAGRSEPTARITCATDMAAWLDETLAGLRIERAHLVGHSLDELLLSA
jgi:pimeloyl-ACP methyl ester carboxylesterase